MLLSTCSDFWVPVRDSLLPAVDALLSGIVVWAALRLRGTSTDVQLTLQATESNYVMLHKLLGRNVSPPGAQARKKSSTKGTTYTSHGESHPPADG